MELVKEIENKFTILSEENTFENPHLSLIYNSMLNNNV